MKTEPEQLWRQVCELLGLDPEKAVRVEIQKTYDGAVQIQTDTRLPGAPPPKGLLAESRP